MANFDAELAAAAQRREEMLAEAARVRMLKAARAGETPKPRRLRGSLRGWLGRQLVAWGLRLQGCPEAFGTRAA